jgi:hypothetical protein
MAGGQARLSTDWHSPCWRPARTRASRPSGGHDQGSQKQNGLGGSQSACWLYGRHCKGEPPPPRWLLPRQLPLYVPLSPNWLSHLLRLAGRGRGRPFPGRGAGRCPSPATALHLKGPQDQLHGRAWAPVGCIFEPHRLVNRNPIFLHCPAL